MVRSRNGLSQACCCLVEIYLLFPQFSPRSWHSHLVFPFSSRISHLASTRKYFSSEHLTGFPHHIYHSMFPTNTHESTIGQLLPMTSLAKLLPCANANVKSTEALDGETSVISTVQTAKNFIGWTSFKPKLRWDSVYHDFFLSVDHHRVIQKSLFHQTWVWSLKYMVTLVTLQLFSFALDIVDDYLTIIIWKQEKNTKLIFFRVCWTQYVWRICSRLVPSICFVKQVNLFINSASQRFQGLNLGQQISKSQQDALLLNLRDFSRHDLQAVSFSTTSLQICHGNFGRDHFV